MDKKEKMTAGLNQTVREMQQLLHAVSQQLAKGQREASYLLYKTLYLNWSAKHEINQLHLNKTDLNDQFCT